ncbi:MAG: geobacillin-26 family protein [Brevinema sp.]
MKKLLSMILSLAMVFSLSAIAFAASPTNQYNAIILEDTASKTISQASDDQFIYTVTKDKIAGTMQVTTTEKATNTVDVGAVVASAEFMDKPTPYASLNENTFTNYEYTKTYGNPNTWELRRPDGSLAGTYYFKTYEVIGKNDGYITTFKNAVDTINSKEGEMVITLGITGLGDIVAAATSAGAIASGGVLTPAAWTAILAAAGLNANYLRVCQEYDNACKSA